MNTVMLITISILISFGLPVVLGANYKYYKQDWYRQLKRPRIALPDVVFNVIFPVFYLLEATGIYVILSSPGVNSVNLYAVLFLGSAVLSGIWSRLFFIYKRCDLSLWAFFLELPFTWIFVYLLLQEGHSAWAFFLPRLVWGLYAIVVNVQFYRLNTAFWNALKNKMSIRNEL